MHSIYTSANNTHNQLKAARLVAAHLSAKLVKAEYDLRVAQAKAERAVIRKAGGERSLAPTAEDRARILTVAVDADPDYQVLLQAQRALSLRLEEARIEVAYLRDQLNLALTAMKADDLPV